jgi:transposase
VLGLELTDEGFDFTVLSEWRKRLIESQKTEKLLEIIFSHLKRIDLVKERGKQKNEVEKEELAIRIGEDGYYLLKILLAPETPK